MTAAATEPPFCSDWQSAVDKELQVTEADLTKAKAEKAAAFMKAYIAENGRKGEEQDAENAVLVLEGYVHRPQTLLFPSPEATKTFCEWLMKQEWSE
jgi:hypothetical protein